MAEEPACNDSVLHSTSASNGVQKPGSVSNASSGSVSNTSSGLNPRSCVTCRRRKVRCDKKHPCTNCQKAQIECIFPAPGRAPRKPRKPQDGELMERLRRLEGVVQSLGVTVQDEDQSPDGDKTDGGENGVFVNGLEMEEHEICMKMREVSELNRKKCEKMDEDKGVKAVESRFGRLVVDEGRSRYINPSFWASLSDEVEDIKGILNAGEESDEDASYPSPESSNHMSNAQGFVFGHSSKAVDMLSLHPPSDHVPKFWTVFKERVDPLVKVLHVPTIEPTILEAHSRPDGIPRSLEALMFAIYYGAVTTMSPEYVQQTFGKEKSDLVVRYKFGFEQALARADFLQTDEVIVLQAFVIFLMCLRRNDDARVIWTLTGLVVRMAQTLGIHRDGGHYDLKPFDTEMRRRLWCEICILDSRASDDHGCDPTITEQSFDTQVPLNVNDEDLSPNMTSLPEPRLGCTEITFSLIRFEIISVLRRIQYVPPGQKMCNQFFAAVSLEQKEKWISECHARIEERYIRHCDMSVPLYWMFATVARLIMSKMWLLIYHPYQRHDGGSSLPQETKDKLFLTSLENIEYSLLLENEERTKKWGWLSKTYVQWHAIAFLLNELCVRLEGEHVDRAWRAIEIVTSREWKAEHDSGNRLKNHLWRPLRRLMTKARAAREAKLAEKGNTVNQSPLHAGAGLTSQSPHYSLSMGNLPDGPSPTTHPTAGTSNAEFPCPLNNMPGNSSSGTICGGFNNAMQRVGPLPSSSSNVSTTFGGGPYPAPTSTASNAPSLDLTGGFTQTPRQTSGQANVSTIPTQTDYNLDMFLNDPSYDPNLQLSPTHDQLDDIMADGGWANWDDMVMQFSATDDIQPGMAGSGQAGAFGGGINELNQWY